MLLLQRHLVTVYLQRSYPSEYKRQTTHEYITISSKTPYCSDYWSWLIAEERRRTSGPSPHTLPRPADSQHCRTKGSYLKPATYGKHNVQLFYLYSLLSSRHFVSCYRHVSRVFAFVSSQFYSLVVVPAYNALLRPFVIFYLSFQMSKTKSPFHWFYRFSRQFVHTSLFHITRSSSSCSYSSYCVPFKTWTLFTFIAKYIQFFSCVRWYQLCLTILSQRRPMNMRCI